MATPAVADQPARPTGPVLLAVGGSAGSLHPLLELVQHLPPDLPAAVLVTVHLGETHPSRLPEILSRRGGLPAGWARDGEPWERGRVYLAPAGFHLRADADVVALRSGARINRHRPSIDALFVSVARSAGPAAVAVVLSGVLDDGAVGAAVVVAAGGQVLVQDPSTAEFAGMPTAALRAAPRSQVLRGDGAGEVAAAVRRALRRLTPPTTGEGGAVADLAAEEDRLTRIACPECGGSLAQVDLPAISYFRCHVGHQYGPETLAAAQADTSEDKLWAALAALEEEAAFQRSRSEETVADPLASGEHRRRADEISRRAAVLRSQVHAWSTARAGS